MIIGITGSRGFTDFAAMTAQLDKLAPTTIIAGGAAGADTLARNYAIKNGIEYLEFLPKFKTDNATPYHPRWYLERNKDIVNHADILAAFWDGKSKGTAYTIKYARKKGKQVIITPV